MNKKEIKLLEELFWVDDVNGPNFRTFEEIESRLLYKKQHFDEVVSEEMQEFNFIKSYKSISQLQVLGKDYARKFIKDINFLSIISPNTLYDILSIGIYNAHKTGQMKILKDALFTKNRLEYGDNLQVSGDTNHSGAFLNVVEAFADCDIELVKKYFPIELGLADKKDSHSHNFSRCASNLIISMLYDNEIWLKESSDLAEKILSQKSANKYDKLVIDYLLALTKKEILIASNTLQEIANVYKKTTWLFNFKNPFLKFFGVYIHGLYNLAYYILPENKFHELKIPEHTVFWKEFDIYNKQNKFTNGKLVLKLNSKLNGLNRLFE